MLLINQNELLLKEMHHRIKNNLQLIVCILNLFEKEANHHKVTDFVKETKNRLLILMEIHKHLYSSNTSTNVDIENYLRTLINYINNTTANKNICFKINAKNICVNNESILALGLIVNELVCNTIKHSDASLLHVTISVKSLNNNKYLFLYNTNSNFFKTNKISDFGGLKLIELLKNQLDNEFVFQINNGQNN